MFFILLTFAAALAIEGLGSLVSVIGISSLFGANPIIIALAIALDVGKVVVVSLLYTYWRKLPFLMKSYALVAATVTMIITSGGAAGYLSGEFQKAMVGSQTGQLKVEALKEQQAKYQERKNQIDNQIANLPERTTVNQRLRLINGFKAEQNRLDAQIQEIDKQLPELQIEQINTNTKVGPILQIAEFFKVPVEEAVKWVIITIIFVFDPLAIFLIIAGNFLWARRKKELRRQEEEVDLILEVDPPLQRAPVFPPEVEKVHVEPEPIVKNVVVEEATPPVYEPIPEYVPPPEPVPEPIPEPEPQRSVPPILDEEAVVIKPRKVVPTKTKGITRPIDVEASETVPHASLSDVKPDPSTIVNAGRESGFRTSTVTKKD